jgi:hypothetical protein
VTALMACAILFALAMLIIQLSTGDLKVSARSVGDKKASIAAETGIQQALAGGDPKNLTASTDVPVDSVNAPGSVYSFSTPVLLPKDSGRTDSCPVGYDCSAKGGWTQERYRMMITGKNTRYDTKVEVEVGIGYITGGGGYQ